MTALPQLKIKNLKFKINLRGFSLIELMVTIAIVAILSAIGMVVYGNAQRSARIAKRAQDLEAIQTALETFRNTTGFYPNGTNICLDTLTGTSNLTPTYMTLYPRDPIQVNSTNCYLYYSNAAAGPVLAATEYKVRTDVPTTEMDDVLYRSRPSLIDPNRDGTAGDCIVTTTGNGQTAWAIYTSTATACAY